MFQGRISLSLVLLLLLVDFMSGFSWELMYISLIENMSSLTHLHGFQLLVLLPQLIEINFFHLYKKDKSSASKVKFRQVSNCKRALEAAKLTYANKPKEFITSQKLGSCDFWRIAYSVLYKCKSAIPPPFNSLEGSSVPDKAKLFAENSSKNSNLDDS